MDAEPIIWSERNSSITAKHFRIMAIFLIMAVAALGFGPAYSLDVNTLIKSLKHKNPQVRQKAAKDLGRMGPDARTGVPALVAALGDDNRSVHKEAMLALKSIGKPAVPALIQALKHGNPNIREGAALALGKIGPGAEPAVPALIRALIDDNGRVKKSAEFSLRRIGKPAVAALKKTRDSDTGPLGRAAGKVLEKIDAGVY